MLNRLWSLLGRRKAKSSVAPRSDTSSPQLVGHEPVSAVRPISRGKLDADALKIVQRLSRYDHQAYLVGGCVRDLLVGLSPKDFDIGTSATPRQIKRLFRNSRIIGRRFRLVHVFFHGGKIIEVATFRAGEDASDGDDLLITDDNRFGTIEQDALRRDFTVNQLFYDVSNQTVIDHCGGLEDLERRSIRTIGNPEIRFKEDPIRLLRAIKFAARMDFEIEAQTLHALKKTRTEIPKAAPPRILEELNRFCRGGQGRRSFELMRDTGIFDVVLPELKATYRDEAAWNWLLPMLDTIDAMWREGYEPSTGLIFAALLLPALRDRFGWQENGGVEPPKGLATRELVDEVLHPIALRLRIPRREQEHCRQLITTMQRMLPDRLLRPRARAAIRRRPCLGEVMRLLEALGGRFEGEFAKAHERWVERIGAIPAPEGPSAEEGDDAPRRRRRGRRGGRGRRRSARDGEGEESRENRSDESSDNEERSERPSRRRGRRGGRGRRRPDGEAEAAESPKPRKDGKWDDYFFDALPSAGVSSKKDDELPYGRKPKDEED